MKREMIAMQDLSGRGILFVLVLTGLFCPCARPADLPGSGDHPLIKRFGGSEIVGYDVRQFGEFELQTSTFLSIDLKTGRRTYARPPLKLEGSRRQIWYEAAGAASSTELLRNYRNELQSKGFLILYDSAKDPAAVNWNGFLSNLGEVKIATNRSHYIFTAAEKKGIRVLSAKLAKTGGDIYAWLRIVEWGRDREVYHVRQGVYAALDIIEVKPMQENMVTVTAEEMSAALESAGSIALYGILFDFNQAVIKPESRAVLDQVAMLLKNQPAIKLHVVGHTDNQGGLDFNMNLSRQRAAAIVADLTGRCGISSSRLSPHGVAFLAPVAVNTTEAGRAKNRRVELIPQ